ncbi:MAG: polymerase sigma factor, sigma-70 family [Chthonomonadales bacterium]|nr:polymerase sigma factor, sigma-70 family [Chthonomonadales bacterium]
MQPNVQEQDDCSTLASRDFEKRIVEARKRVYRMAFRMLGNYGDAEDITQETLMRAWAGLARYDPERSFDAWISRIATNLCIDRIRQCRRRGEVSLETCFASNPKGEDGGIELADLSLNPEKLLLAKEIDEALLQEIQSLPPVYRRCILLHQQEYTYVEIADRMQCSLGTVRSRLHRARILLGRRAES